MVVQLRVIYRQRKGRMTLMMPWMNSGMHPVSKYTATLHPANMQRNNRHTRRWKAQQHCPQLQKGVTPSHKGNHVLWRLNGGEVSSLTLYVSLRESLGGVSKEYGRRLGGVLNEASTHLTTVSSHLVMVNHHPILTSRVRGVLQQMQLKLICLTLSKCVMQPRLSGPDLDLHINCIESLQVFPH